MITQNHLAELDQVFSLAMRRAYLQLSLEERRKRLAVQADRMMEHYKHEPNQIERQSWQGGDIVESE